MKTFFFLIFAFSFQSYGQSNKKSLFTKKEIDQPLQVKELDLSHKFLKELPVQLIEFKNLEEIDLSENPDLDLPAAFQLLSKLKNLRSLSLSNIYKSIPDNISTLDLVEELNLEKNNLASIPEGVKKMMRLRKLSLWDNDINVISLQTTDFPNLEEIELGLNKLTTFPGDLWLISNLKNISAYKNLISLLSPDIKNFHRLEELNMKENKISNLPIEFGELKTLRKLDLSENQLFAISPLSNLIGLEELKISNNKIKEIPDQIGILTNLKELSLSSNPIKLLSEQISNLQSLKSIIIDGIDSSKLAAYLSLLSTLAQLKTLSITLGGITEMPKEFEKLTQVNRFLIWDCDLLKTERKRLRVLFPKASFNFHKSWSDDSFYKYKPCSMDENNWDSIFVNNFKYKYLLVGQNYKYTDKDGIHYWDGQIVLNLDKKTVGKATVEKILFTIAGKLGMEGIVAAKTCRTFEIMHSALPAKSEEVKKYYKENFIGMYSNKSGYKDNN